MSKSLFQAIEDRRSYYSITDEEIVSQEKVEEIITFATKHTPTAFNSQSSRVVILFNDNHKWLWELTKEQLRPLVDPADFSKTEARINTFKAGYGTVLFFEDTAVVDGLCEKMPTFADQFPIWSEQSAGMLQFAVWTSLEASGLGASLQHYNPLIDEGVATQFSLPKQWKLRAQMPFGKPTEAPGEKSFEPIKTRVKVFK